jgi:hypothetical protein
VPEDRNAGWGSAHTDANHQHGRAHLLPSKEFNTWKQTPIKTYPGLKTFIHEVYTRRLQSLALRTMTGQQGYLPGGGTNMFNMLESKDKDTDTANDATTATQTAAFTTASTLGITYGGATTIPSEISTAINQLAANQLAIQQQMTAMTFAANSPSPHPQFQIPPIQNMGQQPFAGVAQKSSTPGVVAVVASVVDVVEGTWVAVEVVADAKRSRNKFWEDMEASPHLSMARQWRLYPQQEHE